MTRLKLSVTCQENEVFHLESRHLGLVTPQEMENLQEKVRQAGEILAKTVDLELLEKIAGEAAVWKTEVIEESEKVGNLKSKNDPVRIAVARDEAFCFYYKDNLELLESLGCEVIEFSPLHDKKLPENVKGILLGGGYPELYGKELAENQSMLESIRRALDDKIPCLASVVDSCIFMKKWRMQMEMFGKLVGDPWKNISDR